MEKAAKAETAKKLVGVHHGVGRRKSSVARVWLKPGKGKFIVNKKDSVAYFDTDAARSTVMVPLNVTQSEKKFDVVVNVKGGGMIGQSDAVKLGVARALVDFNAEFKPLLKEHKLLTVDSRIKERKKYGQRGARAKFQFVKR